MSDLTPILGDVAIDLQVQAQRAAACGLVRVNELPLWELGDYDRRNIKLYEPHVLDCGKYNKHQGRMVVITRDGDAWWGMSRSSKWISELRRDFCAEYGIQPGEVHVPASNGEEFYPMHLVERLADPFCKPTKGYTSAF